MSIRRICIAAVCAFLAALAAPAQAGLYEFNFSASGFGSSPFGAASPLATLSGSIVYSAPDFSSVDENAVIESINLTILGHTYTAGEVSGVVGAFNSYYNFGGTLNGYNVVAGGTNDFDVSFSFGTLLITTYSVQSRVPNNWSSFSGTASVSPYVADVPEPASAALVLLGLGTMGWAARRRKREGGAV
jgi:hypothetical protein